MKKQIIYILFSLFLLSCTNKNKLEYYISSEQAYFYITSTTTKSDLKKIGKEFHDRKNIIIDFSKTTYDKNNVIDYLIISIDCNDGYKGNFKCTNSTLKMNKLGFIRDYNNSKNPFKIGKI